VQNSTCRQTLSERGEQRTKVRFILPTVGRCARAPVSLLHMRQIKPDPVRAFAPIIVACAALNPGTNGPSVCGAAVGGPVLGSSGFCASAARRTVVAPSVEDRSTCRDRTDDWRPGRRAGNHPSRGRPCNGVLKGRWWPREPQHLTGTVPQHYWSSRRWPGRRRCVCAPGGFCGGGCVRNLNQTSTSRASMRTLPSSAADIRGSFAAPTR
jgi:hypothetical protein